MGKEIKRSITERWFLVLFLPAVIVGYLIYKYPGLLVDFGFVTSVESLYLFGKSPAFWYSTIYTSIVCGLSLKILFKNKSPYKKGKKTSLISYQRKKWISIFASQVIFFYIVPFIIPALTSGRSFFSDPVVALNKNAAVYVSPGFTSWAGFVYVFVLVPLSVYLFGKRYCSWFCSCGNLAEVIGVTKWGSQWVKFLTPRGLTAKRLEHLQTLFLTLGIFYGFILFLDVSKIFTASSLLEIGRLYQDLVVDLLFGALIGIGAYPFFGTRVWCRYGCPLAKGMELFGRYTKSRVKIQANSDCKGLDLCTQVCPMGIDVASYAHKDKVAIEGSFGLDSSCCIACGGCVDVCPKEALSFTA